MPSEPYHIQNTGIFWTQDIFRTLSRYILAYSEHCITLAYQEPYNIQNLTLLRISSYLGPKTFSESCLFRHIQAYSIRIVIITLPVFFHFNLNLTYFLISFKKTCFLTTMTSILMFDWVFLSNPWKQRHNGINKTHALFSENKFCDRKESYLTKHSIKSKVTDFFNFLHSASSKLKCIEQVYKQWRNKIK